MKVKIKLKKCSDIEIETDRVLSIYQRNDSQYYGMYAIEYANKDGYKETILIHPSRFKSIKIKR